MNTLRCIFLILALLLISMSATAQIDTLFTPAARIGVDVSGFARHLIEEETLPVEFSFDYEWQQNYFAAAEVGWLNVDVNRDTHRYNAQGFFFRTGVDIGILGGDIQNPNDHVLISLRYGYGRLKQEAPYILISDAYWGDYETSVDPETYHAHWIEAGLGMKTSIWSNLFIGWSLRGRVKLGSTSDPNMEPYFISGYGKTNNAALMLHYSIYYRFPI
jgi:hypothetical protein